MSHISKIELEVRDLVVLGQACKRMGFCLEKEKKTFRWYGKDSDCDHAITIPGAEYEIGVVKKGSGFELACDYYDQNLVKAIGENGGRLKQAYAVEKATIEARRKGYTVREEKSKAGVRVRICLS